MFLPKFRKNESRADLFGCHALDIFFALLAVYFIVRGCMRGFVGEMISLAGFVLAFLFAFRYSMPVSALYQRCAGINNCVSQLLAVASIWLLVTLVTALVRALLKRILSAVKLGGLDTLLGVCSGALKFAVTVYGVIILGFLLIPVCSPVWMTDSEVLRYAGRHWPAVRNFIAEHELVAHADMLPRDTLEQTLRPYRTGTKAPR